MLHDDHSHKRRLTRNAVFGGLTRIKKRRSSKTELERQRAMPTGRRPNAPIDSDAIIELARRRR